MIRPVSNANSSVSFKSYSKETTGLLKSTEGLFDNAFNLQLSENIRVSREGGDLDFVKHLENKSLGLSKFGEGNILLQVVDKTKETVDVFYHNATDDLCDKFFTYSDTKLFPWNKGRDMKTSSKFVSSMNVEEKSCLELMCKKYIPEFLKLLENTIH